MMDLLIWDTADLWQEPARTQTAPTGAESHSLSVKQRKFLGPEVLGSHLSSTFKWLGWFSLFVNLCGKRHFQQWDTSGELGLVLGSPAGCMDILERGQRRAVKMGKGLKYLTYKEKLRELSLFSVEKKRLKGIFTLCRSASWEALRLIFFFSGARGQDRKQAQTEI